MTELRQRMIEDMRLHGLSEGTQQVYVRAVRHLAEHYKRSPDQLTENELRQFFIHLIQKKLARSTVRVRLFAIKFLYRTTLKRDWALLSLVRVKKPQRLPPILSPQEVWRLLQLIRRPQAQMSCMMMYACGLRVSEAIRLRASDIDSQRMVVCVRHGKGDKDRQVPLPERALTRLRAYWAVHRPASWLFPSRNGRIPINRKAVGVCLKAALKESGIDKKVSCHTLRHSYATGLLEAGVNLRVIQALLGHQSLKSTMVYVHLTPAVMKEVHKTINELMADL
jgi:site-specific recombinase XerD